MEMPEKIQGEFGTFSQAGQVELTFRNGKAGSITYVFSVSEARQLSRDMRRGARKAENMWQGMFTEKKYKKL